jgi:hypothetical protein
MKRDSHIYTEVLKNINLNISIICLNFKNKKK